MEPDREALTALYEKHHSPPPEIVSKLPKGKGRGTKGSDEISCDVCGGWHLPGMFHLDYVGHADTTRVLIEADPLWSWEPLAFTPEGLPLFERTDRGSPYGLWIKLTVHGKTMLGYGSCDDNKSDAEKELIGDAIRNAAMRLGIALDLWSKAQQAGFDPDANRQDTPERQAGNRSTTTRRTKKADPPPPDLPPLDELLAELADTIANAQQAGVKPTETTFDGLYQWASESPTRANAAIAKVKEAIADHVERQPGTDAPAEDAADAPDGAEQPPLTGDTDE